MKTRKHFFIAALVLALCLTLSGCGTARRFDGSIVRNDGEFRLDYRYLNQTECAQMTLSAGDTIRVQISHTSGSVTVTIAPSGQPPIYEGNNLTDFSFTVCAAEAGTYDISVTGNRACGSASFTVEP